MKLYLSKKLFMDIRAYACVCNPLILRIQTISKSVLLILLVTSSVLIIRPEQELNNQVTYTSQIDITTKTQIKQFLESRNVIIDFLFVNQFNEDINQLEFIKFATVTRDNFFTFELALQEVIPHAYWHTGTGRIAVDLHGNVLTNFTPKERPVIIEFQEISQKNMIPSPNRDALLTLKLIEDESLADDLIDENVTYVFTKSKGLSARLQNGAIIILGDSTNIDEKMIVWNVFKKQINTAEPKNPIQLDLRFKNQALISNNSTSSLTVQKLLKD